MMALARTARDTRTNGWDGSNDLAEFELVQDGRFSSGIKTNLTEISVSQSKKSKIDRAPTIRMPIKHRLRVSGMVLPNKQLSVSTHASLSFR